LKDEKESKKKESQQLKEENILNDLTLQKVLKYNRFHQYLLATKKYTDLFWSKEAFLNFILTVFISSLLMKSAMYSELEAISLVNSIIPVFIGGLLTILGLSLSGLAIVTATLGDKFLTTIIKAKKLDSLFSIIFNFYFAGFIIGLTVVILTISYVLLSFKTDFSLPTYFIFSFISIYLVFFSVIYSIMLLGTCIRLFLTKYTVLKKEDEEPMD